MSAGSSRFVPYLLGTLPPADQEAFEEQYFTDPSLHEELEAAADDLIHDYLAGALSHADRQRFETHFLRSSRQRQRLALVRAVVANVAPASATSSPRAGRVPSWLAQAAVLAALALTLLLVRPQARGRVGIASVRPTPPTPVATRAGTPAPGGPAVVRIARAAKAAEVVVPRAAASVRFEVAVDGLSASYDAVVRSLKGVELWRARDLEIERDGAPIVFSVPSAILAVGQYVLAVEGEALRGEDPAARPALQCTLRVRRE